MAYVDISGIRMKFENPIKAVEACFHSFICINIKYPTDCSRVWYFIQKLVYFISSHWDTDFIAVSTIINDLQSEILEYEWHKISNIKP